MAYFGKGVLMGREAGKGAALFHALYKMGTGLFFLCSGGEAVAFVNEP